MKTRVPGSGFRFQVLVPGSGSGFWFRVLVPSSAIRVPFRISADLAWRVQQASVMPGARKPEDLAAWQFAWELKERIGAFTSMAPAMHDRKFCEEITESARSAPDNISEGFYRFSPPDFANFVRIARGSLGEVRNQLKHARSKRYVSEAEFLELFPLCERAIRAATGLRLYLLGCPKNFDPRKPTTPPPRKQEPEP